MTDLVEFLRARLDEDERVAKAATDRLWLTTEPLDDLAGGYLADVVGVTSAREAPCCTLEDAEHIARHDPARVLREVEAKRRILARHPGSTAEDECPGCGAYFDETCRTGPGELCPELADMALVYADHPDYREERLP